ncbi:MAG: GNAT family N-acetyltransferase [Candidatus Nanoarchaeia archaeon]|nr:GNAT family N-acetyltransferase [Candidatus Nanoarchaeia archaeon]
MKSKRLPLPIAIRKMIPGNPEYLAALINASELSAVLFPEPITFEEIAKTILSHEDSGVYVARDRKNSQFAGFNIWYENLKDNQPWFWIQGVSPQYQRMGIGEKLMRYCLTDLERLGYTHVNLKTYNGFPSMIRLCRRLGFARTKKDPLARWGPKNTVAYYYTKKLVPSSAETRLITDTRDTNISDANLEMRSNI